MADLRAGCLPVGDRTRCAFRAVRIPPELTTMLDHVHGLRRVQRRKDKGKETRLWDWSAVTAWRKVKAVLESAGVEGYHASPKGLRHGFGHAQLSTTAIYAEAMGPEERNIAARLWT